MAKLPLPLHCYNEAGRVLPSTWFNLIFLWGARALIVLAASMMLGPRGESIPKLFFPIHWQHWAHIGLGILYIALWLLVGRREWLWDKLHSLRWLKPAILTLLFCDLVVQCMAIATTQGAFSLLKGLMLLITCFLAGYVLRSKRTRIMFKDWSALE